MCYSILLGYVLQFCCNKKYIIKVVERLRQRVRNEQEH